MADDFRMEVTNAAAFDAAMNAARASVADLRGPLGEAARAAITEAQAAAPRRTGRLAGAHRAQAAQHDRVRIVADTAYAAPIHWGWPGHGIARQPWLVASWMRSPTPIARMTAGVQAGLDRAAART